MPPSDSIQNMSQAPLNCLKQWMNVDKLNKKKISRSLSPEISMLSCSLKVNLFFKSRILRAGSLSFFKIWALVLYTTVLYRTILRVLSHCIIYSAFSPCLARFRKRSKVCWCRSRDMKDEVILVDKISNLGAAPAPMPVSFLDEIQSATEKKWNIWHLWREIDQSLIERIWQKRVILLSLRKCHICA